MKKHYADPWVAYSKRYDKLYWPPGKPTKQERKIYRKFIRECFRKGRLKRAKILLLGATPSLRDELAKFNAEVTLIDLSKNIIRAMNRLINHKKKEIIVEGNWIRTPLPAGYFDIVIGDIVLANIDAKNRDRFLKEVKRVLKPRGYWIHRLFYMPSGWGYDTTEKILKKFSKMRHNYDRNTELFECFLTNTYNPKTHEVYTSKIKEALKKYWKNGRYVYPDNNKVEELMNRAHEMWKPFKKMWHTGTKKDVFLWISKYFDIVKEDYATDHFFGESFPILLCRAR